MSERAQLRLDADQSTAVEIDPGVRQIVLAGPGSGKTEVVSALLEFLVDEEDVSPTEELLVVSFSRAAVSAVRRRTARDGRARVTVRTLDSLAARVLEDLDEDETWRTMSFDRRIVRATRLLAEAASDEIDVLRHFVVDEVQDVVGVRAEFLIVLLEALPDSAGFTLLGDPMQAVYDFQLTERHSMRSSELLSKVRAWEGVVERRLHGQYRAKSPDTARLLGMGAQLAGLAGPSQASMLEQEIGKLPGVGAVDALAGVLPRWKGTTVCLCLTNGEALVLTDRLWECGIEAQLQRSAQEPAASPLIARLMGDAPGGRMGRDELLERARGNGVDQPERFVLALADLVRGRGHDIDVQGVARRLSSAVVPVELQLQASSQVIASTVHRSKGLEFDNVALMGAEGWLRRHEEESELEAAVRTAFVALTRSKERLLVADTAASWNVVLDKRSGRWIRRGRERWQTFGFEIRGGDTRAPLPPGDEPGSVQAYLAGRVAVGDPVELLIDRQRSTLELPVYEVRHRGVLVGRTTEEFGTTFVRRIGPGAKRQKVWPELSGARVEGVETVGGPPQTHGSFDGAGRWGIWLSVRVAGMVHLAW